MSSEIPDLPDYDELPKTDFGIGASWGMFGPSDEDGLLNLHGPATTLQAAQSIVTGEVIRLDVPLDFFDPPLYGRPRYTRDTLVTENGCRLPAGWDHRVARSMGPPVSVS